MPFAADLDKIRLEVEANQRTAAALCEGLGEEKLAWRATPGSWSIAENLFHLKATGDTFLPAVDRAIEEARRRQLFGSGPFRLGLMGRIYVWYVEPPPVIRLPAPAPLRPIMSAPATDALSIHHASQLEMMKRVEAADGLNLEKAIFVSPLGRYIRMNLMAFFCVYTGHERRHLVQAMNVRQALASR